MKTIEKAFFRAQAERTRLTMIIFVVIIGFAAMQLTMFIGREALVMSVAAAIILTAIILRRVKLSSKRYLHKLIKEAVNNPAQESLFFSTADAELQSSATKTHTEEKDGIFTFVTPNWLILVTPNGSLICRRKNIREISTPVRVSTGKTDLRIDFFDNDPFLCPYEHLYWTLVEWIDK